MDAVERVARAISGQDEAGWNALPANDRERLYGGGKWVDVGRTRDDYIQDARAALTALKYEDGADEAALIQASHVVRCDPVAISEAWDAMIDAHLAGV